MIRRYKETFIPPFKECIPCYLEAYQLQVSNPLRIISLKYKHPRGAVLN